MAIVNINGSSIETTHEDFQKCRTIADLKKLNIFTDGSEESYASLAKELGFKIKESKPPVED